ncbi:MAG: T9SS type A sorting domain-containing protein, partial [Candidatus Marinimicrobia bacterium]|nr:T9SS type A sorting domain-containing protein [Candidatus Neomarinimicrobiota bacterium]
VALVLNLDNSGDLAGENIELSVTLDSLSQAYVDNLNSTITIPHFAAHGSREIRIPLDVSHDFPQGHSMDIIIQMDDGEVTRHYEKSFLTGLPVGYVYLEDFEYDRLGESNSRWMIHTSGSIEEATSLNVMDVYDKMNDQWSSVAQQGDRALSLEPHWVGSLRLVSPPISLDGFRRPELSFMEQRGWDHTRSGGTHKHDVQLQYADDLAGPWYTLSTIVTDESELGVWKRVESIDLETIKDRDVYLAFNSNQPHYYWRLDEISIRDAASDDPEIPVNYRVFSYPNPFNANATILYDLDARADVLLEVFNIRGQRLSVLREGSLPAGTHAAHFNASEHASGIYICSLLLGHERYISKMTLMK